MSDTEVVHVRFEVATGKKDAFMEWLQGRTNEKEVEFLILGYRADDYVSRRAALIAFVDQMEVKLRQNEHKRNWREKPVAALLGLMRLEEKEFEIADEFFNVGEARTELVDMANFVMMVWDRLGSLDQDLPRGVQADQDVQHAGRVLLPVQ